MTDFINAIGGVFFDWAAAVFIQTAVLVAILGAVDLLLRNRIHATLRYWIWMLVFVKLLLPPTLCIPTGVGYWLGRHVSPPPAALQPEVQTTAASAHVETDFTHTMPLVEASRPMPADTAPVESLAVDSERLTWQGAIFLLWGVGLLLFAAMVVQRLLFVRGLLRQAVPARDDLVDVLDQCRRRMGVRRYIGFRLSQTTFSPAVCGLLRPTILVPPAMLDRLSPEGLRAILIHELAHVKRGDLWVNSLQTVLQIVYFYNPLVWLANAIVRRIREQAVDEMVLVALGAEARSYGNTLIDIAEMAFLRVSPALRLIGVAESRKSLQGRIKHMMARPMPKKARVGVIEGLLIVATGAILLPMARATSNDGDQPNEGGYALVVLDDCDEQHEGKDRYDDRLYLLDSEGNVKGAVSGFNTCETLGSPHMLAVDARRRTLWVAENVGTRLRQFNLATGELLRTIPGLRANSLAVDPDTGNVWVQMAERNVYDGRVRVVSPSGQMVAEHRIPGFDIVYSHHDDCFWVVGQIIHKVAKNGKVLGKIAGQIPFTAVSVSIDEETGAAWVAIRAHAQVTGSTPELWTVSSSVQIERRIDLGELIPYSVAVDADNGVVWVGCVGTTLRFTTGGEKLLSAREIFGYSVAAGPSANSVFAANRWGLTEATVADGGFVHMNGLGEAVFHKSANSDQKWVAKIPWAGAKLSSSPELASLSMDADAHRRLADYPESKAKLDALGRALLVYANDYEDKLPAALEDVRSFVGDTDLKWFQDNLRYLGKGKTLASPPDVVVAYDKTILDKGVGTLVLYIDSRVAFEGPHKLKTLGIETVTSQTISRGERLPDEAARAESAERLVALGRAALIYTINHQHRLPARIEDLPDDPELPKSWFLENVTYLGRGLKTHNEPDTPIAYDKTLLLGGHGTNVLRLDTQVVFEPPGRLKELVAVALREASRTQLFNLGVSLLTYAREHQEKYPDTLEEARNYISADGDFSWVLANVTYLGKGGTPWEDPGRRVLAYNKILQEQGEDTIVVYRDCNLGFVPASRLSDIGIQTSETGEQAVAIQHLKYLALAALMYADDHNGEFARSLGDLKPYVGSESRFAWIIANVEYLAAGVKGNEVSNPGTKPLAYWKTAPTAIRGTAVAFFDGHVESVPAERLAEFGIAVPAPAAAASSGGGGIAQL